MARGDRWCMATSSPPIFRSAPTMKCGCWILESPRSLTFTHSRTHLEPGQSELLLAGALEPRASGSSRGPVGGGSDAVRNGGRLAAVPGAGYAQAGRADSIAASSARAAGRLPVGVAGDSRTRRWPAICTSVTYRRPRLKTICGCSCRTGPPRGNRAAHVLERQSDRGEASPDALPRSVFRAWRTR